MTRTPLQWFPFYPLRWRLSQSVAQLTSGQRGAYLDLLCEQWVKGSLPVAPETVLLLLPRCYTLDEVTVVLDRFFPITPHTDKRMNADLSTIRERQELALKGRRNGAAKSRRHKGVVGHQPDDRPDDRRQSKSKSKSKKGTTTTRAAVAAGQETWWTPYLHLWQATAGTIAPGRLAKAMAPVVKEALVVERGDPDVLARAFQRWLSEGRARFGPEDFAKTWREWMYGTPVGTKLQRQELNSMNATQDFLGELHRGES